MYMFAPGGVGNFGGVVVGVQGDVVVWVKGVSENIATNGMNS